MCVSMYLDAGKDRCKSRCMSYSCGCSKYIWKLKREGLSASNQLNHALEEKREAKAGPYSIAMALMYPLQVCLASSFILFFSSCVSSSSLCVPVVSI